ncbi:hypothetical protein CHS0354_017248 [Potamilus streckersoni]|uniref:Peptidase M12B domain-containing protein n=1 Tax=Potamilus streckersoni TaxID=2493646 RepID=A0AAE0VMC7_9BIVA|nr:hypothetical protein CHS0354_017248 [Potamilus streckersoni]
MKWIMRQKEDTHIVRYSNVVTASLETVWLKDVNTRTLTDEQTLCDPAFPNEMTFHLQRGPDTIILNLKRNNAVNPNADVYYVQRLENGRSALFKKDNLEMDDVAYYQDRENGAVMTVRYVKSSHDQCHRVINGNIQIGDRSYDLRPAEIDVASRSELDVPDLLGMQYDLQEQDHMDIQNSVQNKAQSRQLEDTCDVEIGVMIETEIWDLFLSTVDSSLELEAREALAYRKIKQAYSHVINGIAMLYSKIDDPEMPINVVLAGFIVFKTKGEFPHKASRVTVLSPKKYIDAVKYLKDLCDWGVEVGPTYIPPFDHVMLFTRYNLYVQSFSKTLTGITSTGDVCEACGGTSIVMAGDFPFMVRTAARQLGRNLGADHDGEGNAKKCKADDLFIMSTKIPTLSTLSRNYYTFSTCSVKAFKDNLKDKECLTNTGFNYNLQEYKQFVKNQTGEVYDVDAQCELILGAGANNCMYIPSEICRSMRCKDPKTRRCVDTKFSAASGTKCGINKWCIDEQCVSKS